MGKFVGKLFRNREINLGLSYAQLMKIFNGESCTWGKAILLR